MICEPESTQSSEWRIFLHKCHYLVGNCHIFKLKHYDLLIHIPGQNSNFTKPFSCNFDLKWQFLLYLYLWITILTKSLITCFIFSNFAVQNYVLKSPLWFHQRFVPPTAAIWNKSTSLFSIWHPMMQNGSFHYKLFLLSLAWKPCYFFVIVILQLYIF